MRLTLPALLLSLALALPAQADVIAKGENGFVSRNGVVVAATPTEAWQALLAPAGWWNGEHTYSGDAANLWIDAQATGCFCEKLPLAKNAPEGRRPGSIEHMRIIYAQAGQVLRMSGGLGPLQSEAAGGTLTITLKAVPEGTRILWEYVVGGFMRYKIDEIAPVVDRVMAEQLARLGAKLGALARPEAGDAPAPDEEPAAMNPDEAPSIVAEPLAEG